MSTKPNKDAAPRKDGDAEVTPHALPMVPASDPKPVAKAVVARSAADNGLERTRSTTGLGTGPETATAITTCDALPSLRDDQGRGAPIHTPARTATAVAHAIGVSRRCRRRARTALKIGATGSAEGAGATSTSSKRRR